MAFARYERAFGQRVFVFKVEAGGGARCVGKRFCESLAELTRCREDWVSQYWVVRGMEKRFGSDHRLNAHHNYRVGITPRRIIFRNISGGLQIRKDL